MSLSFHAFRYAMTSVRRASPSHPVLRLLIVIGLALAAPVAAAGGVHVAAQGSSLAQAFGQAFADNP